MILRQIRRDENLSLSSWKHSLHACVQPDDHCSSKTQSKQTTQSKFDSHPLPFPQRRSNTFFLTCQRFCSSRRIVQCSECGSSCLVSQACPLPVRLLSSYNTKTPQKEKDTLHKSMYCRFSPLMRTVLTSMSLSLSFARRRRFFPGSSASASGSPELSAKQQRRTENGH